MLQRGPTHEPRSTIAAPVDVLIQTYNEEANLPHALRSLAGWVNRVFVVDSGSTDGTERIAREMGAEFIRHAWEGYAGQKNWALANLPFTADWTLILDADEAITPPLRDEIIALCNRSKEQVPEAGFYINRYLVFLGHRIFHCGYFPSWNLRVFRRGTARYEDRPVHEHMILDGPAGFLKGLMSHEDRRGLEYYIAKHNRYSTLEAELAYFGVGRNGEGVQAKAFGNAVERRRFFKTRVYPGLPAKWLGRFLWMYFLKLGVLDGLTGLRFCLFISSHELFVGLKLQELKTEERRAAESGESSPRPTTQKQVDPMPATQIQRAAEADPAFATEPAGFNIARGVDPDPFKDYAARFGSLVQPGMRVLVTGASGFIGANLLGLLNEAGAEAINIDQLPPRNPAQERWWKQVDLRDAAAVESAVRDFQPDLLLHLAARTDLKEKQNLSGYSANSTGVENLLAAIERTPSIQRAIITSSQLVCQPGYTPQHETDYAPHTLYGESKVLTERAVRAWKNPTCPWVLTRPTSIWGPWFDIPYKPFFLTVARGRYFHQRGSNPLRSFGFVGNVIHQYMALADAPVEAVAGRTFYVADLAPIRVRQWAEAIQQEMGVAPLRSIPMSLLKVAAKTGDAFQALGWKEPPLTSFRLKNMTLNNVADMEPTRAIVGVQPYTLQEGVRMTVRWLREQGLIA